MHVTPHLQLLKVYHAEVSDEVVLAHVARIGKVLAHHDVLDQRLRGLIIAGLLQNNK